MLCACTLAHQRARADDTEVDTETTLQAYDVQSPATSVVWSRRRLTQSLGLRYVRALADTTDDSRPAPSIAVHARLRLNQDFGDTCLVGDSLCFAVVNPARRGSYTPLANNGLLDMPLAYIEARDLPYGTETRAGRQVHYDAIGFTRIDGVSVRTAPSSLIAVEALAGALVRRESIAGTDSFVPDGIPRLALDPLERQRASYIAPEITSWLLGANLELGDEQIVRGSVAYRALLEDGAWVERRVGAGLTSHPLTPLRLSTHAVLDTIDPELIDADAGADLWLGPYRAHLELERHVPRFDPASIWAFFDVAPVWIAGVGASRQLTEAWSVDASVRGRRTELSVGADHDLGFELGTTFATPRDTMALSGFGWASGQGPLWGASVSGSHRLTMALTLEAELSAMRIDDPLRIALRGVSLYELLGARIAITDESSLQLALSHAHSEPIGQRLSFMAFLHLGAWR